MNAARDFINLLSDFYKGRKNVMELISHFKKYLGDFINVLSSSILIFKREKSRLPSVNGIMNVNTSPRNQF